MKCKALYIKPFLLSCLLASGLIVNGQDSIIQYTLDSSFLVNVSNFRFQPDFNFIYHYPEAEDTIRYHTYRHLIAQQPTKRNHETYYALACSLWALGKIRDAEKMFLAIVQSNGKFYDSTYSSSSDIPGDTTTYTYGYGSFTSNYKNYAAIYLTKISLEQKQYWKALQFLEDAVKKYKVTYTCGTGFYRQQDEYDFLYASCYNGLKRYTETIDRLLPSCLERNDQLIITALKNTYSAADIQEALQKAESSIVCTVDTFPSYGFITRNYGTADEKTDTISYFSGSAIIYLFGREVNMLAPHLENGERMTRDMFVKYFMESACYISLTREATLVQK